jgi:ribosomal protein S18 acetylase RimI-like enzyme
MQVSIDIRTAVDSDAPAAIALWADATIPSATDDEAAIRGLVARDPEALLVATRDGRVIGTLIAGFDGWRGQMYRLAVAPEERRHGVARALVDHAETSLRERGARRISALVIDDDVARTFWLAAGYDEDERDRRFVKTFATEAPTSA